MQKGTGTGLIGLGIVLVVIGLPSSWTNAVTATTKRPEHQHNWCNPFGR